MPASRDHFDKFFLTLTYFYYEILILIMLQCINEKPCFHHNLILAPLAPLKSSMCTGAFILISESPQWLLAQGNFNLFKRTFQERSETEGSSLTETRPKLLRRSFPRHGGTLLCLSKILICTTVI